MSDQYALAASYQCNPGASCPCPARAWIGHVCLSELESILHSLIPIFWDHQFPNYPSSCSFWTSSKVAMLAAGANAACARSTFIPHRVAVDNGLTIWICRGRGVWQCGVFWWATLFRRHSFCRTWVLRLVAVESTQVRSPSSSRGLSSGYWKLINW